MATHKSARKRIRTNLRRKEINKRVESRVKTLYKKTLKTTDLKDAETLYKEAVSYMDKNTVKGIIHRNNSSRKKATLTLHLNKLQKAASK